MCVIGAVVGGARIVGPHDASRAVRARPGHRGTDGGDLHERSLPWARSRQSSRRRSDAALGAFATGAVMLSAAFIVLRRARRRFTALSARRAELERLMGATSV